MNCYFSGLTGFRGIAAVMVVLHHISAVLFPTLGQALSTATGFFSNGYLWVDFFFLLSGFLLHGLYAERFESGSVDFKSFVVLRFSRIYPLHFSVLIAFLVVQLGYWFVGDPSAFTNNFQLLDLLRNVLMIQAIQLHPTLVSWNGPAWSISAEWWVYLSFPLLLWLLRPIKHRAIIYSVLCVLVAALFGISLSTDFQLDLTGYLGLMRCLFEFVGGMLLFRLHKVGLLNWLRRPWTQLGLLLALFFSMHGIGSAVITVVLMGMLIVSSVHKDSLLCNVLETKTLKHLGLISYSIYMVHWFVFLIVEKLGTQLFGVWIYDLSIGIEMFVVGLATLLLIWLVSECSFKWLEQPCRTKLPAVLGFSSAVK